MLPDDFNLCLTIKKVRVISKEWFVSYRWCLRTFCLSCIASRWTISGDLTFSTSAYANDYSFFCTKTLFNPAEALDWRTAECSTDCVDFTTLFISLKTTHNSCYFLPLWSFKTTFDCSDYNSYRKMTCCSYGLFSKKLSLFG